MTISQIASNLSLTALVPARDDAPVTDCYIGDLLSWVMGRAPEGCAWITVMGNVNAVAVAKLADVSMIILCEGAHLDDEAKTQAGRNGIALYASELPAYRLAVKLSALLEA